MKRKDFGEEIPGVLEGNAFFIFGQRISIVVFAVFLIFLASGNVFAYNIEGNGNCNCGNCGDCTDALNDNANCNSKVKLNQNITDVVGTCINNPANFNNKIFDCQGHTIEGDGSGYDQGIFLDSRQNNTIKNCIIRNFSYGIYLNSSSNNTLTNNTANSNNYGILLHSSSNNTLTNNTANSNNQHGIQIASGSNNKINTNTICLNNQSGGDYYDVYNEGSTTTGDDNTFCTAYNYYFDDGENSSHPMTYSCYIVNFTITLNSPANNSITSNTTPTFNFTTTGDTDTYSCELFINNTGHGTTTANNNTATTITSNQSLANGIYIWNITCSVCGNINSSESRILTINDTTSPTIEITYPSSNSIVNNYIINGTSTDENLNYTNYTNISIKQGNTIINSTINTSANWSVSLYVSNGTYNITATAYDKAENENSTINTNITIDTTPPQIGNASATLSSNIGQPITLTVDATDENLNTSKVIAQITDPNNEITNHTMSYSSGNTYSYTFISNKIGLYSYTFFAFDTANNSNLISDTTTLVTSSGGSDNHNKNDGEVCNLASECKNQYCVVKYINNETSTYKYCSLTHYFIGDDYCDKSLDEHTTQSADCKEDNQSNQSWYGGGGMGGGFDKIPKPVCGDGICSYGENADNCILDCKNLDFDLNIDGYTKFATPGTDVKCWFVGGDWCEIYILNNNSYELVINVSVAQNYDDSYKWAYLSNDFNKTKEKSILVRVAPKSKSEKPIYVFTSIPQNQPHKTYRYDIYFDSGKSRIVFPIVMLVGSHTIERLFDICWQINFFKIKFIVCLWHILLAAIFLIFLIYLRNKKVNRSIRI